MEEFEEINLHDFRFNFGVYAKVNGTFGPLPEEFGRFMLNINVTRDGEERDYEVEPVNCSRLFPHNSLEHTAETNKVLLEAFCFDDTQSFIKGTKIY